MHEHDRVVVHVDHARIRGVPQGHLVDVLLGGQAGADVEELPDALLGHVLHGADQEAPVRLGPLFEVGGEPQQVLRRLTVGGEVVLAAEQVVVDAGRAGHGRVDLRRVLHAAPHREQCDVECGDNSGPFTLMIICPRCQRFATDRRAVRRGVVMRDRDRRREVGTPAARSALRRSRSRSPVWSHAWASCPRSACTPPPCSPSSAVPRGDRRTRQARDQATGPAATETNEVRSPLRGGDKAARPHRCAMGGRVTAPSGRPPADQARRGVRAGCGRSAADHWMLPRAGAVTRRCAGAGRRRRRAPRRAARGRAGRDRRGAARSSSPCRGRPG